MKDALSTRMKENYENRTRFLLPRRSYTLIRVDGKAFHTYTKGLKRPFDMGLIDDMDATALYLCKNIMGAQFAFVQSDEITILITDFKDTSTQAWFDNNLQKMCSISASLATAKFNQLRLAREAKIGGDLVASQINGATLAMFDSRVWQIPDRTEVENYMIWRQQDTVRNSIFSVAQSLYSQKELHKKNGNGYTGVYTNTGNPTTDLEELAQSLVGNFKIETQYLTDGDIPKTILTIRANKYIPDFMPVASNATGLLECEIRKKTNSQLPNILYKKRIYSDLSLPIYICPRIDKFYETAPDQDSYQCLIYGHRVTIGQKS